MAAMPAVCARESAAAPGTSHSISASSATPSRPAAAASISACRFEPRPEASTATRISNKLHVRLARGGHHLTDGEGALPRGLAGGDAGGLGALGHHQQQAQPVVEGAPHLLEG